MDIYIMLLVTVALLLLIAIVLLIRINLRNSEKDEKRILDEIARSRGETQSSISSSFKAMGDMINDNIRESSNVQDMRLKDLNTRFSSMAVENELKLENIRKGMEDKITALTNENNRQLDRMRDTVDEKLQKTLDEKLSQSFKLVSERLEEVYKGLGEMQNLASSVGDLKKVLSNVKTRGILGEVQLASILENILTKDQYAENVATRPGSSQRVEFAICLPGEGKNPVYLPVDAKFPGDSYMKLQEAYDSGDKRRIEEAGKELEKFIKLSAKKIHELYVEPPFTTEFAIMFLPVEGLYAEACRRGMIEVLQREYKINIAGPTTMAALLNSLQMGFRTLALEKHSSEVWEVLGAVKTEFAKFEDSLKNAQSKITSAGLEIDKLIGTRTNVMNKKLKDIENLPETRAEEILGIDRGNI